MEKILLSNFQKNIHNVIENVIHTHQPVMISDKGKFLVKIVPLSFSEQKSWIGCMKDKGKIIGDIISPAENIDNWKVLSE